MKVMVCAPKLFVPGESGGGERYASEFITALTRENVVETSVVTGVGYRALNVHDTRDLSRSDGVSFRAFCKLVSVHDVVHVFQLDSHLADVAIVAALRSDTALVLSDLGGGWPSIGRILGHWRNKLIDGVGAISQASLRDLKWNASRPFEVLYGGGDHLEPRDLAGHDLYDFVYVGRLVPHKGIHLLLKGLPPEARCLIAGSPLDEKYLDHLRSLAPAGRVEFLLRPTDADLANAYASARWSVFPTCASVGGRRLRRPELLGLSPIESLAMGTPTILSDIPAYLELAELVGMPTFQADDGEALHRTLLRAMLEEKPNLKRAQRELSWQTVAKKAISLYDTVLK